MAGEPAPLPTSEIFSKLDLTREGLTKVRKAVEAGDRSRAAAELLAYYRARKTVRHHVDPTTRVAKRGKAASERDLQIARNALKHVFISQSSYPPHNCGRDIDWHTNPHPDREWLWQLHRMYWWVPLGKAWWHTGDEAFAKEWCAEFLNWRKDNPQRFKPAWRTLEAGIRGHSLCTWYHYFRDSEAFTPEFLTEFLASAYDHAVYLTPRYSKGSNWGLMESEGLAFIAITFPEFKDATVWRDTALKRLTAELTNQVLPDGMQKELSFSYHAGCIGWFKRTADLAEMNAVPVPKEYGEKLKKLYHILAYALKPDGTYPMFGDCWNNNGLSKVREGAELYKRADWEYIGTLTSGKRSGTKPEETSVAFPDSGLYFMRSDWSPDAIWMGLKCGPNGGWHCQPDNGSFELHAYGSYLMPDSGCFIYSGDAVNRKWFSATTHHQCVTLDGKNSAYAPKLRLWQTGPELTALTVENQSYPGLTHRRNVFFIQRKVFLLVDELLGDAKGERRLHFQFGPPDALLNDDGSIALKGTGAGRLLFKPVLEGFCAENEEGQVAFKYRKKQARSAFGYNMNGKPVFAALLIPHRGGNAPACSAKWPTDYVAGAEVLAVEVTFEGRQFVVRRDLKAGKASMAVR